MMYSITSNLFVTCIFCSSIKRSVTPNEHQDLNNAFAKLLGAILGIINNSFLQQHKHPYNPPRHSDGQRFSIASCHSWPQIAVAQVPNVATTRNSAEIVENQPTPILSMTGRHAADPAAANRYLTT